MIHGMLKEAVAGQTNLVVSDIFLTASPLLLGLGGREDDNSGSFLVGEGILCWTLSEACPALRVSAIPESKALYIRVTNMAPYAPSICRQEETGGRQVRGWSDRQARGCNRQTAFFLNVPSPCSFFLTHSCTQGAVIEPALSICQMVPTNADAVVKPSQRGEIARSLQCHWSFPLNCPTPGQTLLVPVPLRPLRLLLTSAQFLRKRQPLEKCWQTESSCS